VQIILHETQTCVTA